ncbi:MAG: helix-hairpin-helix domain-containing protein [Pseudomonadales bacterium]
MTTPSTTTPHETLHGVLIHVLYHDDTTGFAILKLYTQDGPRIACGNYPQPVVGEELKCLGYPELNHPKSDFQFHQAFSRVPTAPRALARYLMGLFNITQRVSLDLVDQFGQDVFRIIIDAPQRLRECGLKDHEIQQLSTIWTTHKARDQLLSSLDIHGVSPHQIDAVRHLVGYDLDILALLHKNPYILYIACQDITYQDILALASQLKAKPFTKGHLQAALLACLRQAQRKHRYTLARQDLPSRLNGLGFESKELTTERLDMAIDWLASNHLLVRAGQHLQLPDNARRERELSIALCALITQPSPMDLVPDNDTADRLLAQRPKEVLAQRTNAQTILAEPVTLIDGPCLLSQQYLLDALTTFAADGFCAEVTVATCSDDSAHLLTAQLTESVCCRSVRRLLDYQTIGPPRYHSKNTLTLDMVVVWQASLWDLASLHALLQALDATTTVVLMGDSRLNRPVPGLFRALLQLDGPGQLTLPPDDPDEYLSTLLGNAPLDWPEQDFQPDTAFSVLPVDPANIPTMLPITVERLASFHDIDPLYDIRVISPGMYLKEVPVQEQWHTALVDTLCTAPGSAQWGDQIYRRHEQLLVTPPTDQPHWPSPCPVEVIGSGSAGKLNVRYLDQSASLRPDETPLRLPGLCLLPSQLLGRPTELIILVMNKDHWHLVDRPLLHLLKQHARRQVLIIGDIDGWAPSAYPTALPETFPCLEEHWHHASRAIPTTTS